MPPRHALAAALVGFGLAPVACTRAPASPAPTSSAPVPVLPAAASVRASSSAPSPPEEATLPVTSAAPAAPAPDPPAATAWTDPLIVAFLARDCAWEPSPDASTQSGSRTDPLACAFLFEQSCVPNPCVDQQEEKCKPACTKTCNACAGRCKDACAACKRGCSGDACKLACATKCGECRQACVRDVDRCETGTCNAARERCEKERHALLEKHKAECNKVCARAGDCPGTCSALPEAQQGACWASCKASFLAGGCPATFYGTCVMVGALE